MKLNIKQGCLYSIAIVLLCAITLINQATAASMPKTKVDCQKHPLYCAMLKLRPNIDRQWAMRFSNLLRRYAKQYNMDPWDSLAIAMQESSLRPIHRRENVILEQCEQTKNKDGKNDETKCRLSYSKAITDMSVFQFHTQTILDFDMDYQKLHDSLEYAVKSHFKLLKHKIENCPSEPDLPDWTCYHSYYKAYRKRYYRLVKRYEMKSEFQQKSKNSTKSDKSTKSGKTSKSGKSRQQS